MKKTLARASAFTHLHVSSGYSFKYGTALPEDLVTRSAEQGSTALALTDRGSLAGAIVFAKSCESYGIDPILGVTISFLQKKNQITLIAQPGSLDALYRLVTTINMSQEKILTYKILEEASAYSSKVIALFGARSELHAAIGARRYEEALSIYHSTENFFAAQYLECTSHLRVGAGPLSTPYAARALGFARDYAIPAILTNEVRMLDRHDGPIADILDASRQLVPLATKHVERSNSEAYLKNGAEMAWVADEIARVAGERNGNRLLADTFDLAERVRLSARRDIGLGGIHLPHVVDRSELTRRTQSALSRYSGELSVAAAARLDDELATVSSLGFEPYFLTVADVADMARARGIRVAARGSGAGSLICYLLGISGVEPISHGLLMERFCSTLRAELPDIDIDVESDRRLEIYDAVFQRYGFKGEYSAGANTSTATVAMVERYRSRHAIRDVGAALGVSPIEIDALAKSRSHMRERVDTPILKTVMQLAKRLYGLPRNLAMHPCAVVLSDSRLLDYAPMDINASGYPMLTFDKDDVEAIGLLKLDILGVRMQSAMSYALREIERVDHERVDLDAITLDDPGTFELIQSTKTIGVFQIESPGQRELIGKFAPETFNDLIIDISLFRPGPVKSDMIRPFLNTRQGLAPRNLIHPDLHEVLGETEGVVVFHEQVIRIIAIIAGVTLAEGDERRRQMSSPEGSAQMREWFYAAASARGYSPALIAQVWDILHAFASFGFCKAHAAAFALPTYQSAWLKKHHTAAFVAGLLTHDPGMYPKRLILDDARQCGVGIAPVDINLSESTYRVEKSEHGYQIRMALADIRGIDQSQIASIIAGRPYIDLADFIYRTSVSAPIAESLVMLGAFDQLHNLSTSALNRRDLLLHLNDIYSLNSKKSTSKRSTQGATQFSLALTPEALIPSGLPDLSLADCVDNEIAITGMDISTHMLSFYGDFLNHIGAIRSSDLLNQRSGSSVLVAGVKVALQMPPIRSGKRVIFITLDDGYGCNDITFFEDAQDAHDQLIFNSSLLLVRGVIRRTGAKGVSLRATQAWELSDSYKKWRNLQVYGGAAVASDG
jgi:error-prone DNA polymerase